MTDPETVARGDVLDRSAGDTFDAALLAAVDYRGDVTLVFEDGSSSMGYVFTLEGDSVSGTVGFMTKQDTAPRQLPAAAIRSIDFSGRDTAEGKSFDMWIKKYVEKKLAGERASIECESLDDPEIES